MDEHEFRRILELFPIVRSRDYHLDSESSSSQSTSQLAQKEEEWHDVVQKDIGIQENDYHDAFWKKLKSAAEKKVGASDAEKFCKAFKQVYTKLVYEELSLDAAHNILKSANI